MVKESQLAKMIKGTYTGGNGRCRWKVSEGGSQEYFGKVHSTCVAQRIVTIIRGGEWCPAVVAPLWVLGVCRKQHQSC